MSTVLTLLIPFLVLFGLLLMRVPVAFGLAIAGALGIVLADSQEAATSALAAIPFSESSHYSLTVIPMFVLMGVLVSASGMLRGMFDVAQKMTSRLPGGLGIATVVASTFFAGISGSSTADAATIGRLAIGEMGARGYSRSYAAAIVAASNTVAILIPPSIALVIFGMQTNSPIGPLLLAGIVPGILTAVIYAITIMLLAKRRQDARGADPGEREEVVESSTRLDRIFGVIGGALLFGVIVVGIYTGVFTSTEAAAVGAFAALVIGSLFVFLRRQGRRAEAFKEMGTEALLGTSALTAMIFALIIGAAIFTQFLVLTGVPADLTDMILEIEASRYLIIAVLILVLVVLGMFLDGLSILLIVAPLTYPAVTELGFSGVWYAVIFVKTIEIGLITPPVGINVYVLGGLFKGVTPESIFARVFPFVLAELVVVTILVAFPEIVTFLPDASSAK